MPWYTLQLGYANFFQALTRASDNGVKKRRGKPPVKGKNSASASQIKKSAAAANNGTKKKSEKRPGKELKEVQGRKVVQEDEEEEEDELSIIAPTQVQSSLPRKRRSYVEADKIAEEPTKAQGKKYMQLETKTKRIAQEIVETWPDLPQQALEQIGTVIKDAKKDIANTQRDERKVIAAHNTLNPLVKRLVRQLAGSKIPPHARDTHFNIDKLTERNGQAFQDVTTVRHSKQLLSEQVKVAQNLLKKDEDSLEDLKKNAKEWKAEWKHQQRHGRVNISDCKSHDYRAD